jgi:hypothetical protein
MTRRDTHRRPWLAALLTLATLALVPSAAWAQSSGRPPSPEPNFAVDVAPRPCALDTRDQFEAEFYKVEGWKAPEYERYPGACQRMRFSYGPIVVKPGQNDVLVGPVTIEKPTRDGYITRFKPNLVRADGKVPPVEQVHLHHGTWLSEPSYGSGPFFAAGEEKTIAPFPKGFGMPVKAEDTWLFLYMVHSAVSEPMETYVIYDIDFIPKKQGDELGLKPAYPVWLDVRPSGYPVFNVHRQFGGKDGMCTWPAEQCAEFDPYGKKIVGQGEPGNGKGEDWDFPEKGESLGKIDKFTGGTLIGIGGHLHPGGLQNEIDLVRPGGVDVTERETYQVKVARTRCARKRGRRCVKRVPLTRSTTCTKRRRGKCVRKRTVRGACTKKRGKRCVRRAALTRTVNRYRDVTKRVDSTRIYNGKAWYWDREDKTKPGGPPTSWDFSMEVQGLPRWGVRVEPGDKLRSNATYDTELAASYENMGIAVTLLVPHDENGKPQAPGVDPFQAARDNSLDCKSGGAVKGHLCMRGYPTHGHYTENGNYGGPTGQWNAVKGPQTNEVAIANFLYAPGDLSTASSQGVPQVKLGSDLRFTNVEGASIWHTITTCAFPCTGQTGAAFPLPDGQTSKGRKLDLDSSELGIGPNYIGPTKNELDWTVPVTPEAGFQSGETVTYFCRVHPFMRGAFEVVD